MQSKDCRHTEGPCHDCDYVNQRNALIAQAEKTANAIAGPPPYCPDEFIYQSLYGAWAKRWNTAFLAEMDRLWLPKETWTPRLITSSTSVSTS